MHLAVENRARGHIIAGCTRTHSSMKTHPTNRSSYDSRQAQSALKGSVIEGAALVDATQSSDLEWLEADGRGGFAAGTVSLCPTRRYHGLLVGPTDEFVERHVFLSRFEESVHRGEDVFALSVARYEEDFYAPEGFRALTRFQSAPWPTWDYDVDGVRVRREILVVRGEGVTLCRWSLVDAAKDAAFELEIRPLLPYRAADALTVENDVLDGEVQVAAKGFACKPYSGLPSLHLAANREPIKLEVDPVWYSDVWFGRDRTRGYEFREDQFSPATLRFDLTSERDVVVAASLTDACEDPAQLWERESKRRALETKAQSRGVRGRCETAADAFLYETSTPSGGTRLGVTAGFPWFLEWGRDTFIALPGLTLSRGRVDECAEALLGTLEYLDGGLIPNIFGRDVASSHYGSVDAALWFARCVRLFERNGGTRRFVIENYRSALVEIADAYFAGTGLGVAVDAGGLLRAGDESINATWMDARTEDGPVTPRAGFAVEMQALWVHLLAHLEELFKDSGIRREKRRFAEAHALARTTFMERFWLEREHRLADVWTEESGADACIRPNMVIAAALEFSPLSVGQRADVVKCARRELLTPRGLRTLSPSDPAYRGIYSGGTRERDEAYHQGTVWPWLLGFYVEASMRAGKKSSHSNRDLRALWNGFATELDVRGLGHMSEVFSGDAPHEGGGTFAQAWNTAECLRSYAMLDAGKP